MSTNHSTTISVQWKIINVLICISLLGFTVTSCSSTPTTSPVIEPTSAPIIPSIDALVTFRVSLPEPLPPGDSLFLVILDEVTGLGLNPQGYIMEAEDGTHYFAILPFVLGSMIQYRYHRQGSTLAQEHLPDGRPVRYRLYHVEGPGMVEDTVSRWTDTSFHNPSGELRGQVVDATNGMPLPSIMVTAGGHQVFTAADGSFLVKLIPSSIHNLVAYSLDGAYQPFQQGALIQTNASTYANIALQPAALITATFVVDFPDETPSNIPVRLAGNLYQLGNSFTDLAGGINSLASRMPTLNKQQDGRYSLSLSLPVGTDLRYKYTLGDGFWNAERTSNGEFAIRQIIVPEHDIQIQDSVDSWNYGLQGSLYFETYIPSTTPSNDIVYIQFDPGFGWTESIPMWGKPVADGPIVWSYALNSPLDMVTTLQYRFCLDGICSATGLLASSEAPVQENIITISNQPQTMISQITSWAGVSDIVEPAIIPNVQVTPRGDDFVAGVAFQKTYQPSWGTKISAAISDIKNLHANWLFFQPTWTYTNFNPQALEFLPKSNPGWNELINWINQAHLLSLNVALIPMPEFDQLPIGWNDNYVLDAYEWGRWFENYSRMVVHFATMATQTNLEALVISDIWVTPPVLSVDSQTVSFDTSPAWRGLIETIRGTYQGKIIWAVSYPAGVSSPPPFLDLVDEIYVLWSPMLSPQPGATRQNMKDEALRLIDRDLAPFSELINKPIVLAVSYPSDSMTDQMNAYNAMMMAINERGWLHGIVSTEYYPPLPVQDTSASVHGKPASGVLWYWFPFFLGQ